jgi:hypothetical protein
LITACGQRQNTAVGMSSKQPDTRTDLAEVMGTSSHGTASLNASDYREKQRRSLLQTRLRSLLSLICHTRHDHRTTTTTLIWL